ncbi:MAG: LbtU family siderophore porin [Deltaproteobacteria bacterium]|nr:LbtU family siderophore porin [Deltaproteobacteria bacterium]
MYLKTLKALLLCLCIAAVGMISWAPNSLAGEGNLDQQVQELIQQNQALTDRLMGVEQQLSGMKAAPETEHAGAKSVLGHIEDSIHIHGLLEVGAAYHSTDMNDGYGGYQHDSDISMTTVELGIEAEINDWVNAEMVLLYEDPSGAIQIYDDIRDETNFEVDEAFITIGNAEETPAFLKAGKMYVPFGALLTHFPDDPGIDSPLTLLMGETNEKALLIGAEYAGFTVCGYVFNGDVEEAGGGDNVIENYGFDANYAFEDETQDMDLLVGGSYISNIADSDWIEEVGEHYYGVDEVEDYVGAAAAYLHFGIEGFFFDAEYMASTDHFDTILGDAGKPTVWNIEAGYNYNWWRNLEIALQYAGSDDCGFLGLPRDRYGINFNQEIFDNTIVSVGYLYDEYEGDDELDRNTRDLVFGQLAVEF